jgi:hypothetical protein
MNGKFEVVNADQLEQIEGGAILTTAALIAAGKVILAVAGTAITAIGVANHVNNFNRGRRRAREEANNK